MSIFELKPRDICSINPKDSLKIPSYPLFESIFSTSTFVFHLRLIAFLIAVAAVAVTTFGAHIAEGVAELEDDAAIASPVLAELMVAAHLG